MHLLIWYRLETVNMLQKVRIQLVETLPMQNCSMKHLHSREAATGCRTCENVYRRRHASNPLLELFVDERR